MNDEISDALHLVRAKQDGLHQSLIDLYQKLTSPTLSRNSMEQQQLLSQLQEKIQLVRSAMQAIDRRCLNLQERLNALRKVNPAQRALIESGNFQYRCMHRSGVRFREYPSSNAAIRTLVVRQGDLVSVVERVFILGEETVFLHVRGNGWLPENKQGACCMELVKILKEETGRHARDINDSANPTV